MLIEWTATNTSDVLGNMIALINDIKPLILIIFGIIVSLEILSIIIESLLPKKEK